MHAVAFNGNNDDGGDDDNDDDCYNYYEDEDYDDDENTTCILYFSLINSGLLPLEIYSTDFPVWTGLFTNVGTPFLQPQIMCMSTCILY